MEDKRQIRNVSTQLENIISEMFEVTKYVPTEEDGSLGENMQ